MGADLAPGYRFCPTDEELLIYYLRPKAWGRPFHQGAIAEVDIYNYEPRDLPDKSALITKDPEWYFFCTQDKKYSHTARINRTTKKGYWKATGKDRKVYSGPSVVGLKKTLIYYEGRAPYGSRTNWIMHEYRLDQESEKKQKGITVTVLCRIRKKGGRGPRNGEQYGAPVWNEGDETDEDIKSGKESLTYEAGLQHVANGEEGGNAFNLQNQVHDLTSSMKIRPVKSEFSHHDTEDNSARITISAPDALATQLGPEITYTTERIPVCFPCSQGVPQSFPDIACFDSPSVSNHDEGALTWPHALLDCSDLDPLLDLGDAPLLPSLADVDVHDLHEYVIPAFNEPEILGEMFSLVNNCQSDLSSKGFNSGTAVSQPASTPSQDGVSHIAAGAFIELKDMETPLGEFVLGSPVHGDEVAADTRVSTSGSMPGPLHLQGSAAQRVRLQMPSSTWSEGRIRNAATPGLLMANKTLPPQVQKHNYGVENLSIPSVRESHRKIGSNFNNKFVGAYSGSSFSSCSPPHAVESSSRSYLSKHISTYAVSKFEVMPAQLCYASFTDTEDGCVETNKKILSSATLVIKDEVQTDEQKVATCSSNLVLPSSLQTKHFDTEEIGFEGVAKSAFESCHPESGSDTEAASVQVCNAKVEHANTRISRRRRLKTSLKGLMSKLKQTSLGAKLIELEEGMRLRFNDRLSGHEKSVVQLLPTEQDVVNPFNRLKMVILATLYNLAVAVLLVSCLFWGYRIVTKNTSWVEV